MALLLPDRGKPIAQEKNVNVRQGLGMKPDAAYDLALYEELGTQGARAVLEVTIILVFDFEDTGTTPSLMWTAKEKTDFMDNFRKECTAIWSEKHQLVTTNPVPPAKVAGVLFDIQTREGVWGHSHWNVKCKKVASYYDSSRVKKGGGFIFNGEAVFDSLDLTPETYVGKKGTTTRRSAIHEFGHMLGYRDEYPPLDTTEADRRALMTPSHPDDQDSIMFWGEKVYPRHYVFFADWISLQWIKKDSKNCKGHDWKVNGTIDLTNAGL